MLFDLGHFIYGHYCPPCLFRQIGLEIFTSLRLTQVHSIYIKMKAETFMPLEIYTHRHTHTHNFSSQKILLISKSQMHNTSIFFFFAFYYVLKCKYNGRDYFLFIFANSPKDHIAVSPFKMYDKHSHF